MLFLANGYLIGNWAPKIPQFARRLGLDESQLGLMIVVFGIGSIATMPMIGILISRIGTWRPLAASSILSTVTLLFISLAPGTAPAIAAMLFFGSVISGMDVAMNAAAVEVERGRSSPIMSSCHGFWSLGGFVGGSTGGYLLETLGPMAHAGLTTLVAIVLVLVALPATRLIEKRSEPQTSDEKAKLRLPATPLPYIIGIAALFAALPEGAVIDWSALYLRSEYGASPSLTGIAFGAFSAAMAIVRFFGDPIRKQFGAVRTAVMCGLIASLGLAIAALAPNANMAISGFVLAGLGLSNLIPIAFSAAGNQPGLPQGIGLSIATTMGYSGILVAPAAIGYIGEQVGFSNIFLGLAAMLLLVAMLAKNLRYADKPI